MADNSGGGNAMLGVIVGVLLVVVIGFFPFGGFPGKSSAPSGPSITVSGGK